MIQEFSRAADRQGSGDPRVLKPQFPAFSLTPKFSISGILADPRVLTRTRFLAKKFSLNQDGPNSFNQELPSLSVILNVLVVNFEPILLQRFEKKVSDRRALLCGGDFQLS